MEASIVNFTSFAARSAFGSVKDDGQIKTQHILWYKIICLVSSSVAGSRRYAAQIGLSKSTTSTLTAKTAR